MILPLLFFFAGLFIGSFLNVLIDRLPRGETVLKGRSHCDKCKHTLAWYDLFPLLSFLFLKGKCRYCHVQLSYKYPLLEILTGILFALTTNNLLNNFQFSISPQGYLPFYGGANFQLNVFFALFIVSCLIVIFFIDLKHYIIPFSVLLPATLVTFGYLLLTTNYLLLTNLYSGLGAMFFFLLLFLGTKGRGMGFGDVIYAFFMGLLLGFPSIIVGLYIAFLTGAVVALILIISKKKKMQGGVIPFGPFLVLGTYIAYLWGENISHTFLTFFHLL